MSIRWLVGGLALGRDLHNYKNDTLSLSTTGVSSSASSPTGMALVLRFFSAPPPQSLSLFPSRNHVCTL